MDFQSLTNLPEINFKAKDRPEIFELANYIDHIKTDLFDDRWSQATKKHIKTSLVLYIRSMQKQLAPMGYHYKAQDMLQMPLCLIDDADKHILEGDWQQAGNWEYPFRRYKLAGYTKTIRDVRGKVVDLESYTIQDHFKMLGVVDLIT